jgi:hypothetical protein
MDKFSSAAPTIATRCRFLALFDRPRHQSRCRLSGVTATWSAPGQTDAHDPRPTFPVKYPARPSWGDEHCLQPRSRPTCLRVLVEGDDFDPVRALACRVASDRLQRACLGVDRVGRDRVRQFAGDDYEAAGRIDIETSGLLLGRGASEIGELPARGIDAEGAERARCALRGVEKAAFGVR